MPTVTTETSISAPLETVYAIAKQNEAFPDFMKDVQSVTVVERDGPRVVSDWVGTVSAFGLKVRWRQEDVWSDEGHLCTFRQVSGDYDKLEGSWRFSEADGQTKFESVVDYEYNVPTIGALVKKVIHGLVVKNLEDTLAAIKDRAENEAAKP